MQRGRGWWGGDSQWEGDVSNGAVVAGAQKSGAEVCKLKLVHLCCLGAHKEL